PGEDVWAALLTNNALTLDCSTLQANGATSYVIGTRITDLPVVVPVAAFSFTTNMLSVDFTDLSTDADAWLWDFGDGGSSTDPDPVHDYSVPGTYTVTLIASAGTCSDTFTAQVVVLTTGMSGPVPEGLSVFPNPAIDRVVVQGMAPGTVVLVRDVLGREVMHVQATTDRVELDLRALLSGTYRVEARGGEACWSRSFVKL
ncbi:MAG: PKD domain-containing protein, partial [Flavobacteriales bacterium]|nr:PKD domain-containing protein [Flavobacteriales bacterium]